MAKGQMVLAQVARNFNRWCNHKHVYSDCTVGNGVLSNLEYLLFMFCVGYIFLCQFTAWKSYIILVWKCSGSDKIFQCIISWSGAADWSILWNILDNPQNNPPLTQSGLLLPLRVLTGLGNTWNIWPNLNIIRGYSRLESTPLPTVLVTALYFGFLLPPSSGIPILGPPHPQGGVVVVQSQEASPRGPGHPQESLLNQPIVLPVSTTPFPYPLAIQQYFAWTLSPNPGKVARVHYWYSCRLKGSLTRVG